MLRLCSTTCKKCDSIAISEKSLIIGDNIWKDCIGFLKEGGKSQIELFPIKNERDELIAYGYQDSEANRELRMLKELRNNVNALQFTDVFPKYKEVIIYGCNELAIAFAKYLENVGGIKVSTIGNYWDYFGYKNEYSSEGGEEILKIYAEGFSTEGDLYHTLKRSVSPEFEYIDKIYEANVLGGRIRDTIGSFNDLINKLRNEQEIVVLGVDREAQDTYDLLLKQGIDISAFAVEEKRRETLLGKKVMCISEAISFFQAPVFLDYKTSHGALGSELTEYFDYLGYARNKQIFLLKDYTDIPTSNLVHILYGKHVLLTGDPKLCELLSNYLYSVENGQIFVKYTNLGEPVSREADDILCLVIPDYHSGIRKVGKTKKEKLKQQLSNMKFVDYTEYFVSSRVFALIDVYLNQNIEKYTIFDLLPKGILLGRIPGWSGNFFFRGIMDGHPEILMIPSFYDLNNNLFYYCIRLAGIPSDNILERFWEMYNCEACEKESDFPNPERFNKIIKKYLHLKKSFTSQELFVLFHLAYAQMLNGESETDISKLVIYWEPHLVSREEFPFFALWLEDEKVNGQTIAFRRNNIIRTGSACARRAEGNNIPSAYTTMFGDVPFEDKDSIQYHNWIEFKMRFEDIKLYPKENLMKICERLGITWSNTMLQTTCADKPLEYRGSVDFDLKPVFNRYDDFLSEFDCFRISLACSPYQKRYGYPYENCLKFTRSELQELFIKPFLFDEIKVFGDWDRMQYLKVYEWMRWKLWEVRKHMILNDVCSEFEKVQLKQRTVTVFLDEVEGEK